MALSDSIELMVGIAGLAGVMFQVARVERIIYQRIDEVKDTSERQFLQLQSRIDLHLQDYANKKLQDSRLAADFNIELKDKVRRLRSHQEDLERYLSKTTSFKPKAHYTIDHPFGREAEDT